MAYASANGGEAKPLSMDESASAHRCENSPLAIPTEKMPLAMSDGTNHEVMPTALSMDSPLPGRS